MLCVGDLIKGMWNDKKMIYLILIDEGLIIFGFFIQSELLVSGIDSGLMSLIIILNGLFIIVFFFVCK